MMKDKIIRFFQYMADAFKYAPVEIFITLVLFVHVALVKEEVIANTHFDWLIPIFFTVSFLLNKICLNKYLRILYYVSAFLFIPFLSSRRRCRSVIWRMCCTAAKRCQHRERMYRIVSGANKTANWQKGSIG